MGALNIMLKGTLGCTVILVIFEVCQSKNYEIRCPEQSEWDFKASAKCGNVLEYFCLLDYNVNIYTEFCKRNPDINRDITWKQGQKCVIRGNLDGEECSIDRYQPFKFRTDGNSDCVYKKSLCQGEGMIIHKHGSKTLNTQCRCDHIKGFAFVSKTKQSCYCIPSQEDCSCYQKKCKKNFKLSSDYNCIFLDSQKDQSGCSSPEQRPFVNTGSKNPELGQMNKDMSSGNDVMIVLKRHPSKIFTTTAILAFSALTISFVIWKCSEQINKFNMFKGNVNGETIEKRVDMKFTMLKDEDSKRRDIIAEATRCKAALKMNCNDIINIVKNEDLVRYFTDHEKLTPVEKESIHTIGECLGQRMKNYRIFEIILNHNPVLYIDFIEALRRNDIYAELAKKIEKSKDGLVKTTEDIANIEIKDLYNDKITEEVRNCHDRLIKDWKLKDNSITETKAYNNFMKQLSVKNCVVVVEDQDYGKSFILHHVALGTCEHEAYEIIPIKEEPSKITQFYNRNRNQIFVVDDMCGNEMINSFHIEAWNSKINNVLEIINDGKLSDFDGHRLRKGKTKILISCNENIYNDHSFSSLRTAFKSFVCLLSDYPLSDRFTLNFFSERYSNDATVLKYMNYEGIRTVLQCKIAEGKHVDEISEMFSNTIRFVENDLNELVKTNHLKFCIITLCTLFDNTFNAEWLKSDTLPDRVKFAAEEVGLNLRKESIINRIQEEFLKKDLLYFSKTGTIYHLIHEDIHKVAVGICGKVYTECFIKYSSSSFIAQHFRMESTDDSHDKAVILYPKYYKQYFDRLLHDLQNGDTYSSFHNKQLKDKDYREQFSCYCKNRKHKFMAILSQLKENKKVSSKVIDDRLKSDIDFNDHTIGVPLIDIAWEGHADVLSMLLDDYDCDVNETDASGRTALYVASARGHLNVVEKLLQKHNTDLSLCDNNKRTPLYSACEQGYTEIASLLISKEANIQAIDIHGCSSFLKACLNGHKQIVEILLEKSRDVLEETMKSDNLGRTPIIAAAQCDNLEIIRFLLDKGVNVNDADNQGFTALHIASRLNFSKTVSILLKSGADMFKVDNNGCSALFVACEHGSIQAVRTLLTKDKSIIYKYDWHERSPLYIACKFGHHEIVELLLKEGANKDACDEDQKSPLYVSIENRHLDVVKQLLQVKVDVNKCDRQDRSPLHVACKKGLIQIVELLYSDNTANFSKCDKWGISPFFVACTEGYIDIVKFLQGIRVSVNRCNRNGDSPLYVACEEGHLDIVEYLLKHGANIEYRNKNGRLAINAAKSGGHTKIIKVLSTGH